MPTGPKRSLVFATVLLASAMGLAACEVRLPDLSHLAKNERATRPRGAWVPVDLGVKAGLQVMQFVDAKTGFVAHQKGTLWKTTDGGVTWQSTPPPAQAVGLQSFYFLNAQQGWATDKKRLFQTLDGGTTWTQAHSFEGGSYPKNESIMSLGFTSPTHGFAGGWVQFYETTDGGKSWQVVGIPGGQHQPVHVIGDDVWYGRNHWVEDIGWVAMAMGGEAFCAMSPTEFWSANAQGWVGFSTDRAKTWQQTLLQTSYGRDLFKSSLAGGQGSRWNSHPGPIGVAFLDTNHGFYSFDTTVFETQDGGQTWEDNSMPLPVKRDETPFFWPKGAPPSSSWLQAVDENTVWSLSPFTGLRRYSRAPVRP